MWFSYGKLICFSLVLLCTVIHLNFISSMFYLGDVHCYPVTAVKFLEWTLVAFFAFLG